MSTGPSSGVSVRELLERGRSRDVRLLAGPVDRVAVREVGTLADLGSIDRHRSGSLLIVLASAVASAAAYEFDIAVGQSGRRGHAALLLVGASEIPLTTRHLADRAGVAVLGAARADDLADLVVWADRVVRGGEAEALARAEEAMAGLLEGDWQEESELLATMSALLGVEVQLVSGDASGSGSGSGLVPVVVQDRVLGWLGTAAPDRAAALVLPAVAAQVATLKQRRLEREFAPSQTRAELLAQLVVAEPGHLANLVEQALRIGFPLDRTHVAVWLDVWPEPSAATNAQGSLAARRRLAASMELAGLEKFQHDRASWHLARVGGSLLLVCSDDADGDRLSARVRADVRELIDQQTRDGDAIVYAGVGTFRRGVDGLRESAEEARAAADTATRQRRSGEVFAFDSTGVTRVLAELGSSPISRRVVSGLLAPLDDLGAERAAQSVETLAAYLDAQSSPRHAAARLHLHPNAVAYRIKRIVEFLDVDLSDPDVRFAVHLACRLRGAAAG